MPIVLISKDEKFTAVFEENGETAEFDLRRLPAGKRQEFIAKCTRRGIVDAENLGLKIIGYCITGWRGILDEHGDPAAVTQDNIDELPQRVVKFIGGELERNLDGGLDPTKTSGSTSEQ